MSLSSAGMRSICCTLPSKYLRSCAITSSHRPRPLRSLTRYSLTTVNSPDRFDLTYRFWYVGSIDCDTPVMLAMVAVGARPGYNGRTHAVQAMGWLRRFVRPTGQKLHWTEIGRAQV